MKHRTSIGSTLTTTGLALAGFLAVFSARADEVTEWNQNMLQVAQNVDVEMRPQR